MVNLSGFVLGCALVLLPIGLGLGERTLSLVSCHSLSPATPMTSHLC